jgi:hypothetical protein
MPKQTWIRSPLWDSFWILSAIPAGLLVILAFSISIPVTMVFLTTALWGPHVMSPIWMAWNQSKYRETMLKNKTRFLWIPLFVVGTCSTLGYFSGLGFLSVKSAENSEVFNAMIGLTLLYLFWTLYHLGAQNYGVLSVYRSKGQITSPTQRKLDRVFCLTMLAALAPLGWLLTFSRDMIGITLMNRLLPQMENPTILGLKIAVSAVALTFTTYMVIRELSLRTPTTLPRAIFILSTGLAPVAIFINTPLSLGMTFLNHWTVAIGLATHAASNHKALNSANGKRWYQSYFILYLGLVLVALPASYTIANTGGAESISNSFSSMTALTTFVTTLFGLRMGTSYVHYLYDRYVYQFRDPAVGKSIGRDLMVYPPLRPQTTLVDVPKSA